MDGRIADRGGNDIGSRCRVCFENLRSRLRGALLWMQTDIINFGFHSTTTTAKTAISTLKNFSITEKAEPIDPPAAGKMSYVLAPRGELKSNCDIYRATHTQGGAPLESISKVENKIELGAEAYFRPNSPGETQTCRSTRTQHRLQQARSNCLYRQYTREAAVIKGISMPKVGQPAAVVEGVKAVLSEDYKACHAIVGACWRNRRKRRICRYRKVIYYVFDAFGSYTDPPIAQTEKDVHHL